MGHLTISSSCRPEFLTSTSETKQAAESNALKGVEESSSSGSSQSPLAETFNTILEEAVTGLTEVVAQAASKRVAEFAEDNAVLSTLAQAAGWTSSGESGDSSGSGGNDPVYRLLTSLGETLLAAMQNANEDLGASSSDDTSDTDSDDTSTTDGDVPDTSEA